MKLLEFKINAGGRFNPDAPVLIDFSKSKLIGATGDEEAGKTTLIDMFMLVSGQLGGDQVVNDLKNRETGTIDAELKFIGKDRASYEVKRTASRLVVKRDSEVSKAPVEVLKEAMGIVGVSPMKVKDAPVDDIVKWLSQYSQSGAENFEKKMRGIKDTIKRWKGARASANKEAKGCRQYLISEGYADESGQIKEEKWLESEEKYKTAPNISELSKKLNAAGNKSDKFIENSAKVESQKNRKFQLEQQIAALQKELIQVEDNIQIGEKWLADNASAKKEYDTIKKQYDTAAQDMVNYNKWQEIQSKKAEMDSFEDMAQEADAKEKAAIKEQQELQWEVIPDTRDVEILLEDEPDRRAGFYYKGMNSRQLSASQWFEIVIQILKKNKVKVLLVDDTATFGSKFMETLHSLVKSGCYVFYTEMKRGQQTIEIEYN